MSYTDILKTPLGIAGIVGSLAIGGGTVIYVVKEAPPVSTSSSTTTVPKENAGAFPMKFVVEYYRIGKSKSQFDCDLSLDYTCIAPGKSLFIALHSADHSKITAIWRTDLARSIDSDWNFKKSGVSWDDFSHGIFLDPTNEYFVQARPS